MKNLRQAVLLSSADRVVGLTVNFVLNVIISRLLTPSEVGVALIGTATAVAAIGIRDFATPAYLVQKSEIDATDVKTTTALNIILGVVVAALLIGVAPLMQRAYGDPRLMTFFVVVAIANIVEASMAPVQSLLQRDMQFRRLAMINVANTVTYAVVALLAIAAGAGYLCFAWAWLCSAVVSALLYYCYRPQCWTPGVSLVRWREVASFGGYHGLSTVVYRTWEAAPALVLGRLVSVTDAGFFGRAQLLSQLIDKIFLSVLTAVALPAFSARARDTIASAYLYCVTLISGVYWPAVAMLAVLADPLTRLVLGAQWLAVVPVVRIICLASIFVAPVVIAWPAMVASGGVRDRLTSNLVSLPISTVIFIGFASFGLTAAAASLFVIMPLQMLVQIHYLQKRVSVSWAALAVALRPSFCVMLTTVTLPLLVIANRGFVFELGFGATALCVGLAAVGWMVGLSWTKHPALGEVWHSWAAVRAAVTTALAWARQELLRRRAVNLRG